MIDTSVASRALGVVADRRFLLALCLAGVFTLVALYVWRKHIASRVNPTYVPNREFTTDEQAAPNEADLYLFYTVWCPHCTKAKPEWSRFKESIGENKVNGVTINFIEVDCDKDTATADRFRVDSYPTIKLVRNDQIIEYDAKPDVDTLRQFLTASL